MDSIKNNTVQNTIVQIKRNLLSYIFQLECQEIGNNAESFIQEVKAYLNYIAEVTRRRGINDEVMLQLIKAIKISLSLKIK